MNLQNLINFNPIAYVAALTMALSQLAFPIATSTSFHSPIPPSSLMGGANPSAPAVDQSDGATASFNWAGYAATGNFTGVSGSWTIPEVESSGSISSDATWIGIGGVVATDLIQTGTQATVEDGSVSYRAWYELLPDSMQYAPLAVHPGDMISASIIEAGPGLWQIVLTNGTTGKSYQTQVSYDSSHSSVEWIEERPSLDNGALLPLDNFESLTWHSASALENGQNVSASAAGAQPITMLSRAGETLASPTGLDGNGGFSVVRNTSSNIVNSASTSRRASRFVIPGVNIVIPVPAQPQVSSNQSSSSFSESVSDSSGYSHGAYSVYVNGKLVEHKEW